MSVTIFSSKSTEYISGVENHSILKITDQGIALTASPKAKYKQIDKERKKKALWNWNKMKPSQVSFLTENKQNIKNTSFSTNTFQLT